MATYKLIQDIEADDKLLGPLSFRQFIYALVAVVMMYLSFLMIKHHAAILSILTLPIGFLAAFLAFPFGKDQPTEVWAISKLRFYIKPRRRIWAQSGVKELVTVTVPKRVEVQRTDGLSKDKVMSRLQALANTIDTRGWAIKNVTGAYQPPIGQDNSDRLISADALPKNVPDEIIEDSEDLFDENTNPIAKQFGQMLSADTAQRHQALIENLNSMRTTTTQVAASVPSPNPLPAPPITQPVVTGQTPQVSTVAVDPATENQIDESLKTAHELSQTPLSNMHALRQRPVETQDTSVGPNTQQPQSTPQNNPVIMNFSKRDDLNLNVISNEVNRAMGNDGSNEVLISLH